MDTGPVGHRARGTAGPAGTGKWAARERTVNGDLQEVAHKLGSDGRVRRRRRIERQAGLTKVVGQLRKVHVPEPQVRQQALELVHGGRLLHKILAVLCLKKRENCVFQAGHVSQRGASTHTGGQREAGRARPHLAGFLCAGTRRKIGGGRARGRSARRVGGREAVGGTTVYARKRTVNAVAV